MEKVREWLRVHERSGRGSGSGYGYGCGYGSAGASLSGSVGASLSGSVTGSVSGSVGASVSGSVGASVSGSVGASVSGSVGASVSGSVIGSVSGSGYGYGSGSGIKSFDGQAVYLVDNLQTIIVSIHLNLAKGFILNDDLTLTPCYVAKGDGLFAHGETPQAAQEAIRKKVFEAMDTDEAIEKFCETFRKGERYPGHEFFEWHHYLTGSCEMGRKAFVRNHDLDLDKLYTVEEFIELTKEDYGGEVIRRVEERYK